MKFFTPLITIAVCVAAYYVYVQPIYAEITTLQAKKAEYTTALEKTKQLKVRRDQILQTYNSIAPMDLDRLKKVIPDTFNSIVVVNDINTIALKYGMTLKGINVLDQQMDTREDTITAAQSPQLPYKTISISFETRGQYEQFSKFLKELEVSLRLLDVTSLSVKVDQKTTNASLFDFGVEVHTYSMH